MKNHRQKNYTIIFILIIVLLLLMFISLLIGRYNIAPFDVIGILLGKINPIDKTWEAALETAVINVRLPRVIMAVMIGGSLAAAGAAYQGVFQNPLASPDLLGASSGAGFGASLGIILGISKASIMAMAFVSSFATVILVSALSRKIRGNKVVNTILAGIMISSLFTAGTSWIKLVADPFEQLPAITYWLMGSISGAKNSELLFMAIPMTAGLIILFALRWKINLLTTGDEEAMTMGINASRTRLGVMVGSTLLTAASVAAGGMIGWVGLVIPHLSRKIVGNDYRLLLPVSVICGGGFLLIVDNLARTLNTTEFPIGILTAFVGAPFFIYIMGVKGGTR